MTEEKQLLLGTLGSDAHSPAPGRPEDKSRVNFAGRPAPPSPHLHTYTHLVALEAPEYATTTRGPVTHIAQEEIHSAHNAVTQKVTEHTIHVLGDLQ